MEAEKKEAERVEAARREAARVEAARVEAERVEAERVEAEKGPIEELIKELESIDMAEEAISRPKIEFKERRKINSVPPVTKSRNNTVAGSRSKGPINRKGNAKISGA